MYNLLVKTGLLTGGTHKFLKSRVVSTGYTYATVRKQFVHENVVDFETLKKFPTIFVEETRIADQFAKIGRITEVHDQGFDVVVDFIPDSDCEPVPQEVLMKLAASLRIEYPVRGVDELTTTHRAVKDADLFRVLLNGSKSVTRMPNVFKIPTYQRVVEDTVVMPFAGFDRVYEAIVAAVSASDMSCHRADTVWANPTIMQDVIALIDTSSIVICDCTGKNPNVFYEFGIAHSLGKEFIIITQSTADIPFDIANCRYIPYLNNAEGIQKLTTDLISRIKQMNDDRQ